MTKAELIKALQDDPSPDDIEVCGFDVDYGYYVIDEIKFSSPKHVSKLFNESELENKPMLLIGNSVLLE